ETKAVNGVSISINKGASLGLLGPNGAGKTTTIRMLIGAIKPDRGNIDIDSQPSHLRSVRSKVGIAPQALALYDELTAQENLNFFCSLYGLSTAKRKERVEWALEFAQLENRRNDRVQTFSGGMKRRLNLATALVHDPEILLLDEPTVGVDPQSRNHIFSSIEKLKDEGRTLIYTTHYMEEVDRLCDTVAIMDHGQVLARGTVNELINEYANASQVTAELAGPAPEGAQLPGNLDEQVWTFESHDPFAEIGKATTAGVQLATLNVARPTLEDVFLNLTGRSLRD
ncbi:MAG: ABC transporter ATP-binding protein, partial [Planctomycetota bacterium]